MWGYVAFMLQCVGKHRKKPTGGIGHASNPRSETRRQIGVKRGSISGTHFFIFDRLYRMAIQFCGVSIERPFGPRGSG